MPPQMYRALVAAVLILTVALVVIGLVVQAVAWVAQMF